MYKRLTTLFGLAAACLIVAATVAGCAGAPEVFKDAPIGYPLQANEEYPFDDSYQRYFAGTPESERALVLVGSFGDEVLTDLKQIGLLPGVVKENWIIHLSERRYNDVYLLPVKVDKEKPFKFDRVFVAPKPNRKSGIKGTMELRLWDSQSILIDKPGIYYFGTIVSNDGNAFVRQQVDPRVVDLAIKKYPKVFEKMPRINF
ncbi:hypothetical protein [Massilia horti]|uniref:DUF4136 domain-containing protein n=1 Tax=Massilia horti TaxID=2562153 RepID=A0A4Y9T3K8_9BURK|nr:hypothetical protein [Massilia horti]TFW34326.1 hypothetical protein E4O92_04285 [Massilia horti]